MSISRIRCVPIVKILKWGGVPLEIKVMLELRPGSDCVQTEWGGIVKGECRQPGWEPEVIAKKKKKKKTYGKYCILVWVSDTIRSPPALPNCFKASCFTQSLSTGIRVVVEWSARSDLCRDTA